MGSKGKQPEPPQIDNSQNEALLAMMSQQAQIIPAMMTGMMGSMSQMISSMEQQTPIMPTVYRAPEVDWSSQQEQLAAKMKADYNVDEARRRTRTDTILTSPLMDEEDANVWGSSILTGER